ncbi:MFS transporter [Antarcticirhabdus aurantiaca]|uniref:MFS transporter n=1 Tax=Antarcticirhabdus aurantiaca TaxID=2606717 RepID=A0ACD4NVR2_9HYPH|nr:MFS transporter [Antarcticirhabdus aurantiaca]WAJ31066.1 MFS transporter [Jeongeuplla avenae]
MTSAQSAAPTRIDPWAVGAAIASISAVGIALGLGLPLLSVILERRGVSASMIGANTAFAGIASLIAAPLVTPIARRLGVATTMLLSIVASALAAIGFYVYDDIAAWFGLRLVFHFAVTTLFILSEFWISAAAPPDRRGLVLGLYATFLSLGFAAGPWLFSQVGSIGPLPFYLAAGILAAASLPILAAWRHQPAMSRAEAGSGGAFWRYVVLVPTATAAVLVFGAVESGGFALFPVYGERIGFPEGDSALLLTAIGLGNVLLQIPIGLLSDRVRDRRHLLVAFALIGLAGSLGLPLIAGDWWTMAAVLFVWGGVVAGLYTVGLAHLGSRLTGSDLAAANAAFIFCYAFGMLLGPQVIGSSMDIFGPDGFAWSLGLFFAAYLALTVVRLTAGRKAA